VKPIIGSLQLFCKGAPSQPSLLTVDPSWLASQKADAPACSTNDILTSALLKNSGARYAVMPVNLRGRIPGIDSGDAGNYWCPQEILEEEFQSPLGVREVVRAATAAREKGEVLRDPRRPTLDQTGRIGVVTNWTAFYHNMDLPGCEQLVHAPLMYSKQVAQSYFVIFRPAKDQIAVWCSVRDTAVMKCLAQLPMFSGSVGMPA
jgi:hypothetical protein